MVSIEPMYPGQAGSPQTELAEQYVAGTSTTITVADGTVLPDAPNIVTITNEDDTFVSVVYATKTGNVLTDLSVIEGATTGTFTIAAKAARLYTAADYDTVIGNIQTLATASPVVIAASTGANGTMSPIGDIQALKGDTRTFRITPNSGYVINDISVDGVSQGPIDTYTFTNIQNSHTISATFKPATVYTVTINPPNETPSTSGVTLSASEGSVGTQAQRLAIVQTFAMHYLLPQNGWDNAIQLDETNLAKDINGNTVVVDGSAGDIMLGIDPFWWTITVLNATTSEVAIQFSTAYHDNWYTAHLWDNQISPRLYVGVFNGTVRTRNGATCLESGYNTSGIQNTITHDTISQYAWNNGDQYNIVTHITWTALQILALFVYGTLSFQDKVAQGYSTGGSAAGSLHNNTANFSLTGGWTQGAAGSNTDCTILGIKNLYAHQWQFMGGSIYNAGTAYIQYDQADKMKISSGHAAAVTAGWKTISIGLATTLSSTYIKTTANDPYIPFFPKAGTGSSSTYYCDGAWSTQSDDRCCFVGGGCDGGATCGLFAICVADALSCSYWRLGARLQALAPPEAA